MSSLSSKRVKMKLHAKSKPEKPCHGKKIPLLHTFEQVKEAPGTLINRQIRDPHFYLFVRISAMPRGRGKKSVGLHGECGQVHTTGTAGTKAL